MVLKPFFNLIFGLGLDWVCANFNFFKKKKIIIIFEPFAFWYKINKSKYKNPKYLLKKIQIQNTNK
jgi:hypothetical protein